MKAGAQPLGGGEQPPFVLTREQLGTRAVSEDAVSSISPHKERRCSLGVGIREISLLASNRDCAESEFTARTQVQNWWTASY